MMGVQFHEECSNKEQEYTSSEEEEKEHEEEDEYYSSDTTEQEYYSNNNNTEQQWYSDEEDGRPTSVAPSKDDFELNRNRQIHDRRYQQEYDVVSKVKFVTLVVRHPYLIVLTILLACIGITLALYFKVLADTGGNPFSPLGMEMDVNDIRSVQYDSLRLAHQETIATRNSVATAKASPIQSQVVESTYWAFESDSNEGAFGDPSSIGKMKDVFDIFLKDEGFKKYCLLDSNQECERSLSPLRMYYASSWDSEKVQLVIDDLKDPKNVELFNTLGWCYVLEINCEDAPKDVRQQDIKWANKLHGKIIEIMDSWDMRGDLIEEYKQATVLASYLLQTDIFKPAVDFGYDKDFSSNNQVSKFSRGILNWGGPLEMTSNQT